MLHRHILRLATTLSLFAATSAFAATQGTLGLTSTGSVSISITKSVQAQIINSQLFGPFGSEGSHPITTIEKSMSAKARYQSVHKKS